MPSLIKEKRHLRRIPNYSMPILRRKPEDILNSVCLYYGVSLDDVKSECRAAKLVKARAVFSYVCRERGIGTNVVGALLDRNHASVIHHHKKYKNYLDETQPWFDAELKTDIDKLMLIFRA